MANEYFFPPIEPFDTGVLEVDEPHKLYFEQCGNPEGDPILFLHGGPGAGCSEQDRCFFDPVHFRIILLDQRGSGRSVPVGDAWRRQVVAATRAPGNRGLARVRRILRFNDGALLRTGISAALQKPGLTWYLDVTRRGTRLVALWYSYDPA